MQVAQIRTEHVVQPVNQEIFEAMRVEETSWYGVSGQAAYYQDGIVIITLNTGRQLVYENDLLIGLSDSWVFEIFNGVECIKHNYPSGGCVYTNEFTQFAVNS